VLEASFAIPGCWLWSGQLYLLSGKLVSKRRHHRPGRKPRTSAIRRRANLLQGSAEELPFENQLFDVVSCLQVIEHLPEPERFLHEANRVLKEDGLLLLAAPNPEGLAAKMLGSRWGGIRKDHISLRPPGQWHKALEKGGFNVLDEGTTLFNGIPLIGCFPLGLPFQLLQMLFGWFHWRLGSSYMAIAKKDADKISKKR
jgi:SAM-dependent methyltransferase